MDMNGAYAEQVCVPQALVHHLPDDVTFEQGAMVEPLGVAMHAVNRTPFQLMDTLVIVGAGTIGLLTLVAARLRGAGEIIITDLSPHRLEMARRLNADVVVNAGHADPIEIVRAETQGVGASAVIEAVGVTPTVKQSLFAVRDGGHVTWIGNSAPEVQVGMQQIVTRELTVAGAYGSNVEFVQAIEAIRSGRIDVMPLIEMQAPLEQGPELFNDLAKTKLDAIKVVLKPKE